MNTSFLLLKNRPFIAVRILKILSIHTNKGGYKTIMSSEGSETTNSATMPRRLAAFDFDYTVVAQNTDTVVRDLLLPQMITQEISNIIDNEGWTQYMAAIFRLLHENNCSAEKIRNAVRDIPEVPGFVKCIKSLRQQQCDLIIISDSNSVFIHDWLQTHGLAGFFVSIFTNPAEFQPDGLLTVKPYHHQTDCRLSAANLCKGKVLEHFIVERSLRHGIKYDQVIYAGDGNNDICPVLRLKQGDLACPRIGFGMAKNLEKNKAKLKLHAQQLHWKNGFDLLAQIENAWQNEKEKVED